jgi:hypothetical protein
MLVGGCWSSWRVSEDEGKISFTIEGGFGEEEREIFLYRNEAKMLSDLLRKAIKESVKGDF